MEKGTVRDGVCPDLLVGDQNDYDMQVCREEGWCVVHACKEPYHRQALGYRTPGAPRDHHEYFFARRDHRLCLNMVDAPNADFIPREVVDAALDFIHKNLGDSKVLVHCNQGRSRSVGIAMLYLATYTDDLPADFGEAEVEFRSRYPAYSPGRGMHGFMQQHWAEYQRT